MKIEKNVLDQWGYTGWRKKNLKTHHFLSPLLKVHTFSSFPAAF